METQELIDSVYESFRQINKRLEALEVIHTRYTGPAGKKGDPGPAGRDGRDGVDGVSNVPGPVGPPGRPGRDGIDGRVVVGQVIGGHFAAAVVRVEDDVQIIDLVLPRGPEGSQGAPGRDASIEDIRRVIVEVLSSDEMRSAFRGERGPVGPQGEIGPQGLRGEVGPQGISGPVGPQGIQGERGPEGLRGPAGKPGDISVAIAAAEREARDVVEEALKAKS